MNTNDIHILLDRYMEGESSQEEQKEIERYFRETKDIPEDLEVYRSMFEVIGQEPAVPTQDELDRFCKANGVELQPAVPVDSDTCDGGVSVPLKPKIRPMWWSMAGIAASVVLVFSLYTMGFLGGGMDEHDMVAEETDTTSNVVRDVERIIYDLPRHEMAQTEVRKEKVTTLAHDTVAVVPAVTRKAEEDDEEYDDYSEAVREMYERNYQSILLAEMGKESFEEVVKAIRASGDEFFESLKEDFEMAETKGY